MLLLVEEPELLFESGVTGQVGGVPGQVAGVPVERVRVMVASTPRPMFPPAGVVFRG